MDWISIALLLFFGLLFLIAEVLFIPGTTVVGLAGFALLAAGIWFGYRDLGTSAGHVTLVTALVLAGIIIYIGLRPKNMARLALTEVNDTHVRDARLPDVQPGTVGRAISALRPSGTVLFAEHRREVVTRGEFVPTGAAVRVLRIEQNRIIVEAVA
ncbi:NfeD-like C-terminal, partner-binding [Hymenobacter daecheongensis DSM 21074]|uniref:NfeD-like C-terminal, partner-binding n=1 Tax=Hymenobacter daecheongensis DSM 21074 TaxID=1121955 RepID=A0A1M6IL82_9BACT|nr:NfeD family protein [Hymenobacter daecheongensis]SHJ35157.1 NfeD-like C-terminal, partner-binding [Hymenobacter daecheongensis DSM 21074]